MTRYDPQTQTGYNPDPPPDDGSQTADNLIEWSKIRNDLTDVNSTYAQQIDSAIQAAFAKVFSSGVTSVATTYNLQDSDNGKVINVTSGSNPVNLLAASTAGAEFLFCVKNSGSGTVTIDPDGSETIDGETTYDVAAGEAALVACSGSAWFVVSTQTISPPRYGSNHITGLRAVSISTTQYQMPTGQCFTDDLTTLMTANATAFNKTLAAFAEGDTNGSLDTGAVAADTIYYIWYIERSDTNAVDALASLSSTAPTMPANYDRKRLVSWVRTEALSTDIIQGKWRQDWFELTTRVQILDDNTPSTTYVDLDTLAPDDLDVEAKMVMYLRTSGTAASAHFINVQTPGLTETAPDTNNCVLAARDLYGTIDVDMATQLQVTAVGGVVRYASSLGANLDTFRINVLGWRWNREDD